MKEFIKSIALMLLICVFAVFVVASLTGCDSGGGSSASAQAFVVKDATEMSNKELRDYVEGILTEAEGIVENSHEYNHDTVLASNLFITSIGIHIQLASDKNFAGEAATQHLKIAKELADVYKREILDAPSEILGN